MQQISFTGIRGEEGIKEATVKLGEREVKIAVVNGLRNAETVIQRMKSSIAKEIPLMGLECV